MGGLKQKLPNIYKRKLTQLIKWNKIKLQDPRKLRKYRTLLQNKLENTPDTSNISEEWERMKEAKTDAASEVIQTRRRTPRNEWRDEECRQQIQKKQEARHKWLKKKTQEQTKKHIKR